MLSSRSKQDLENGDLECSGVTVRVPVEMQCEFGQNTETKLKQIKAHCVENTTITEHYYDTDNFLLASTQTWLTQQDGHWRLILEQRQNESEKNSNTGDEDKIRENQSPSERSDKTQQKERVLELQNEGLPEASSQTVLSPAEDSCSSVVWTEPVYTALTDPSSIITQLSQSLPETQTQTQNLTIQSFLEAAKIQIYHRQIRSRTVRYSLNSRCSLVVKTIFNSPEAASSAVLTLNADVLNINTELEKMDRMCTQLDLKIKHQVKPDLPP
ncbi:LOW QUALITY PROTEIN: uncharacterized protein si:dkey-191c17.2 [Astyanax mexicanus]|uniref:LOW QUALITY PROTEIN: uncharacterized protein si:dkey-191c17.2 n=1 Tax=Astyanax mexicanus TaxID=7994 RepID=UPI0020CADA9F|nr:LOW QUALITY PROTEIN: uncharacterized protein si:dkey-191c17.2 [Astyanax mexicanus]